MSGVYDPGNNRLIVFGGLDANGNNLNDVWILTNANGLGGTGQWINLIANDAAGSPPARSGHSAAYDATNNILMIFGGCTGTGGSCAPVLNDVWTLSNANGLGGTPVWTQLQLSSSPPARAHAVMIYDTPSNQLAIFDGYDGSSNLCATFTDLWLLSNANGTGGTPFWGGAPNFFGSNPTPASGALAVSDGSYITIFGGMTTVSGTCQATNQVAFLSNLFPGNIFATWLPTGQPLAGSPSARAFGSAVADPTGARILLFGGKDSSGSYLNDLFNLANGDIWQQLSPTGGPPAARANAAVVFDSTNQRMIVFGGSNTSGVLNDTWELTAPAQPIFSCTATAGVPNLARAEGIAELMGDLVLNCIGGTPTPAGQPIPQYTLTLTLNASVTSRPTSGGVSEALATIDEPYPAMPSPPPPLGFTQRAGQPPQILCVPLGSACSEAGTGDAHPYQTQPNVFAGEQSGAGTLQWTLPIDPPGPGWTRVIRITNVRANASQLGVSATLIPTSITLTTALQGPLSIPIAQPRSGNVVAEIQTSNTVAISGSPEFLQCRPHNPSLVGSGGTAAFDFSVNVQEAFSAAFKSRNYAALLDGVQFPAPLVEQNIPGFNYNAESGFYSPSLFTTAPTLGLADSGTRILVEFQGVSSGTHLFVPTTIAMQGNYGCCSFVGLANPQGQLQLVQADQHGSSAPGYQPVTATAMAGTTPVAEVNYSGSTAYAIYEVVAADPSVLELAAIPVAVAFNSPSPASGTVTAATSLAPLSSVMTEDASAPLPRFTNVATGQNAYAINSCSQPALSIAKTHVGNFFKGQKNATYTVLVSNPNATSTHGTITVTETIPSGLTLVSMTGGGWICSSNTCSRSDALSAGKSFPAVTVLVNVGTSATSPQVNTVSVSGAGFTTASTTDPATIAAQSGPVSFLTGFALSSPALRNDFSGWVGMKLKVGPSPLTVTSLGRVCVAGNSGVHTVQFVKATGTAVAGGSAQVNMSGCTPGQFAYTTLTTSIVLKANTTYLLASQEFSGGDRWYDWGGVSSTADAAVTNPVYSTNGSNWVLFNNVANTSYVPANFLYIPGDEPSTSFLTGYALNHPALRNDISGWVGMQFTVGNSPIAVTSLGRLCIAGNSGVHEVQIWAAGTGTLLENASSTVNMSGCSPGQFVYRGLTGGVTLQANTAYYLASFETAGGDRWYDSGQVSSTNAGAVNNPVSSLDGTHFTAPVNTANTSYVPANFTYASGSSVTITVQANPSYATVVVDGVAYPPQIMSGLISPPQVFQWNVGDTHTISVASPQTDPSSGATRYIWTNWSDGGAISHSVSPTTDTTYTANFNTQYALIVNELPLVGGSVTLSPPPSSPFSNGGFYDSGTTVQLTPVPFGGYTFLNWSGNGFSVTTTPLSFFMGSPNTVTANFQATNPLVTSGFVTGYALNNPPLRNNFSGWVGMAITTGANPLTVTSLGRLCLSGNSSFHSIEFVNASSGVVVPGAFVQVNMSGCTPGQFVYTTLPANITLLANTRYYLATEEFSGGDSWYDWGTMSATNVAAVNNSIYSVNGTSWAAPANQANTSYVPPSFTYLPPSQQTSSFLTGYALNNPPVRNNFSGWVGMTITTGASPLAVTSLGRLCLSGNSGIHAVEFVNAGTGAAVSGGSVQVNMSGCTAGQFVYTALSSNVTLQASTRYYLASQEVSGGDSWYDWGTVSSTNVAAVNKSIYSVNGTAWASPAKQANTSYVPVNFEYLGAP